MSDIIQIFCEDKHHYQVLSHLLAKRQSGKADVRIVQTGGVRGARAFKEGYNLTILIKMSVLSRGLL